LNVKEGQTFVLLGTADKLPVAPTTRPVFLEDLKPESVESGEVGRGAGGLVNLGNTCYLNSTIQVLHVSFPSSSSPPPLAHNHFSSVSSSYS
jgi:ubiquitin carboxyl-terminal hydrolase 14